MSTDLWHGPTTNGQPTLREALNMVITCPRCHGKVAVPEIEGLSTHIDFACDLCGAQLRLSVSLVLVLALVCALPCIFYSYGYFPSFTFVIGDTLIFLTFTLLFWPLRSVRLRSNPLDHV